MAECTGTPERALSHDQRPAAAFVGPGLYRRGVDYESLVPVISSLLGALIGAGAVLVSQRRQWKQDRQVDGDDQCERAVQELSVRASSLDMASHQAVSVVASFSSLGGQLNRLIGIVTPLDHQALFNGMNTHFEALNRAAAQLRMTQNQETIKLTNAVMFAAGSVIEAHHAAPSSRWSLVDVVHNLFAGRQMGGDRATVEEARATLGEAVRVLVEYTRKQLNHPHVDQWAVPETCSIGGGISVPKHGSPPTAA